MRKLPAEISILGYRWLNCQIFECKFTSLWIVRKAFKAANNEWFKLSVNKIFIFLKQNAVWCSFSHRQMAVSTSENIFCQDSTPMMENLRKKHFDGDGHLFRSWKIQPFADRGRIALWAIMLFRCITIQTLKIYSLQNSICISIESITFSIRIEVT